MDLAKLDKYKKQYSALATQIDSLRSFINQAYQRSKGIIVLSPYAVAHDLDIPEFDAYFLLSLAEKEDIVQKKYKVWADDNTYLGDYSSQNKIPDKIINNETGKEVDREHFYVDLVFEIEK